MATNAPSAPAVSDSNNLSKDEVGWYFVEQYYNTLSKSPEKLHLFYGKRSQFVYGKEAEVANVSVGRQAIQERIKALDFQDCKVRLSNVDSQASFDSIVIQVIGETSNKSGEPRKFVQTFILAQQPSGYFVLNDILRFIDEEGDDEPAEVAEETTEEPAAATEPAAPVEVEAPASVEETVEAPAELDTAVVAEKLEETVVEETNVNGSSTESVPEEVAAPEAAAPVVEAEVDAEAAAQELAEEDAKQPEKVKEPAPTPAAAKPAAPAEPAGPPKPMTWASRAAAAAGPKPVVPLSKTPPVPAQTRAPAPAAAASQPAAAAPAAAAPAPAAEAPSKDAAGWQTAGSESKRQNRPQSVSNTPTEKEGTLGYVKYVTEKVQEADLRAALAAHGELTYFDINRQKNCAFVEYKNVEGYQAAVAANPHIVNGENIVVEPRRPKANAYGGSSYGSSRGGASGRGRGGFEGSRSGSQGPRGNFSGQNRGRGGAARGRGGAQANNA